MSTSANVDNTFVGHILLDIPAEEPALGFAEIAAALASIIETSNPRFAVGVFGGWGTGKSTLMEAIAARLDRTHNVIVDFNGWRYEREPHLILPLLDTIRDSLARWGTLHRDGAQQAESIARRIGRVVRAPARGITADIGVPGAATINFDAARALDEFTTSDFARSPQSVYFAAFSELQSAFQEVNTATFSRIVVFVDDLDRCLPNNALTLIEAMKLFFDMPGFIFVVGMDEQAIERAVRAKFLQDLGSGDVPNSISTIDREYVKKLFQVPYSIPTVAPAQLAELLGWIYLRGGLAPSQQNDLDNRVRRYLRYVAVDGRINPREVKRFINAYTLQRMIRPSLDPDVVLALQTFDFRYDWETAYELLIAEPDVFVEALGRYRGGDLHALENLWSQLAVLPLELASFLRSDEAGPLVHHKEDIEIYLSSLQSSTTAPSWLHEATRDVGQLRQLVREVRPDIRFGSQTAQGFRSRADAIVERMEQGNLQDARLSAEINRLREHLLVLAPPGVSEAQQTTVEQIEAWKRDATHTIDQLRHVLRLIRRSYGFGPP